MTLRSRSLLGILSIVLLILSTYVLANLSFANSHTHTPFNIKATTAVVSSFNISIIFAWIAFGILGGATISAASLVAVLSIGLAGRLHSHFVFMTQFFIATAIGYSFSQKKARLDSLYSLKLEHMAEDTTVLSSGVKEKERSIQVLKEKMQRYSLLKEVAENLSTVLSLDSLNKIIIENALKTLEKPGRVLLFLVDVQKQELMLSASRDAPKVKAKKGDAFDRWVLRNRKSLIVEDVVTDFRFPARDIEESKGFFRSLISAPLVSENKAIGILRMDSLREFMYVQDDLRLLDIIADLSAVAVQNALLYSRTQELAIKDSLTGLAVRRYFMARFKEEIKRAARSKGELSLLMFDIDHFKNYNDKYGHISGDLVLKHLARLISSMAREGDIVARYGGEEMAVLLCGRNKNQAASEAESIRKAIEKKPLMLRRQAAAVTVSIGLANYPDEAVTEEELIRIADERLYKAKAAGRNRVCSG